jgi:hypothetical protein
MNETKFSSQKLVLGLVLLAFGTLAFVDSTDLWYPGSWWRMWPLALIILGLASEIDAFRERRGDGGSILIAIGLWFLAATQNILGLTHRTAFPVAIAVVGLFMAIHAVVDRPAAQKKESNNEPC